MVVWGGSAGTVLYRKYAAVKKHGDFESLIILWCHFWYIRQDERSGVSSHRKAFSFTGAGFCHMQFTGQTTGLASLDATVTFTHITLLIIIVIALVAFEISGIRKKSDDGKNGDMDAGKRNKI